MGSGLIGRPPDADHRLVRLLARGTRHFAWAEARRFCSSTARGLDDHYVNAAADPRTPRP